MFRSWSASAGVDKTETYYPAISSETSLKSVIAACTIVDSNYRK